MSAPLRRTDTNTTTHYFREPRTLDEVKENVFARAAAESKRLSIWCAGCSTGDEPYTLSMLAEESGATVQILGTDINPEALERARAGWTTTRNLRHTPTDRIARWFHHRGDQYILRDTIRNRVSFAGHALGREAAPPPPRKEGWDVIFCRNLLIYLDAEEETRAVETLVSGLAPGGLLFLSASESLGPMLKRSPVAEEMLELAELGSSFTYRRRLQPMVRETTPAVAYSPPPPTPAKQLIAEISDSIAGAVATPAPPAERISEIDALLDTGRLDDARCLLEHQLNQTPTSAALQLRLAVCLLQKNDEADAGTALRKATFLQPDLWPALFLLGQLVEKRNPQAARRYFERAAKSIDATHGDEALGPFAIMKEATRRDLDSRLRPLVAVAALRRF